MTEQDFIHYFMLQNPTWDKAQIKKQILMAKTLYQEIDLQQKQESLAPVKQELVIRRKKISI